MNWVFSDRQFTSHYKEDRVAWDEGFLETIQVDYSRVV